jgi:hypothetical protein
VRPVTQLRVGRPSGQCTEACIASLLEVPLEEVPDLWDPTHPDADADGRTAEAWERLYAWIRSKGFVWAWGPLPAPLALDAVELDRLLPPDGVRALPDGHHMLGGPNPDGAPHWVVARHGKVVWDPNPTRRGITRVEEIGGVFRIELMPEDVRSHASLLINL